MRWVALSAVVVTAGIGLLHTPLGRPLMMRVGMGCPARKVSPEAAEALRMRGVRGLRGPAPAPARPALGLALDGARQSDAQAWAAARGGTCAVRERPSSLLTCHHLAAYDEVTFGFAPDGRLVSVATLRERLPGAAAAGAFEDIHRQLAARLATDGELAGDPAPARLEAGPLRVARLQYRFADYLATVTAMNLPEGIALREQYQSARD
ncbi:MAG TPA: hypothetical protein VMT03_25555 [Polyangia bacterium]|nr:hypothetical protein [Polyangia bacterium]